MQLPILTLRNVVGENRIVYSKGGLVGENDLDEHADVLNNIFVSKLLL